MKIELFEEFLENLKNYIKSESQKGRNVYVYKENQNPSKFFEQFAIKVGLGKHKEIILQEETRLELGGIGNKSFSLVFPFINLEIINHIKNGTITLIGPEIKDISDPSTEFGLIILIGGRTINEKDWDSLRQFSLISNGIEGFLIRTIPRKFWCRISENIIENFSFEFLGNAIFYLYKQQFIDLIESMEIIFISAYTDVIDEFVKITSEINNHINEKWLKKIENWKKKIDCEYDWGCEICPYRDTCYDIKQVLVEREKIEK
jgi:CO dehydrogenase/acetyl-CoA synthase beta subunit